MHVDRLPVAAVLFLLFVAGAAESFDPPTRGHEQLSLDCPLPQIGVNTTRASAFYFVNGAPVANESMQLRYQSEGGSVTLSPSVVYPQTGEHVFIVDVRTLGNYSLQAQVNGSTSNPCAFPVLQENASAIPELPELFVVLVALSAFFWTRRPT
ncbi:hypothetical protein HY572_06495 [Candidatus Micrarchaeota archaeon]|nr:hypothetical protein [Candidatus Micrarchaeota archaeon]